ncbi:hypothetical protein OSB04_027350 [Centaurea solstitialis]|uniref:Uncharacterized protein n=1 Tax=Centaurea solstitialis TaxID=347529 RepID=A0AA38W866_9ASTR|nr:hypothetical protein OSB04_027350 [Centaurea solstitialis]
MAAITGLYHNKVVEGGDATKAQLLGEDDCLIFKPGGIDVSKWKQIDSRSLGITQTMVPPSPFTVLQILQSRGLASHVVGGTTSSKQQQKQYFLGSCRCKVSGDLYASIKLAFLSHLLTDNTEVRPVHLVHPSIAYPYITSFFTGFEAYLVGGCVRDLLLKRPPKDFDVITTADLNQIRKQFHRNQVVGRRFPVTSFDTFAKDSEEKEKYLISHMPSGSNKLDLLRWKNSMHRDFTINSLFFDPFIHKIYDYNDGMKDLSELKLRTLVPAKLSFTEDSARILRGLRIAARLGLSLSKEIKSAILKNISSISTLGQFRITMELNYMLSYGAAESSISLLHKYHLLEILLPFQKLLSHLDKLVACDHPSGSSLWFGLLGFHMALVNNPQHPFVIMTFASVLYHQSWEDGLKFARKCGRAPVSFEPETLEPYKFISDDEAAEKVKQLATLVVGSIDALVDKDRLNKIMAKFTGSPCSGPVFLSRNMGNNTRQLFHVLAHKVETYKKGRTSFEINYDLLGKGDSLETRFALGKIILDTMGCGVHRDSDPNEDNHGGPFGPKNDHLVNKKEDRKHPWFPSNLVLQQGSAPKKQTLIAKLSSIMQQWQNQDEFQDELGDLQEGVSIKHTEVVGISPGPKNEDAKMNKPEISMPQSPMRNLISVLKNVAEGKKSPSEFDSKNLEEQLEGKTEVEVDQSIAEHQRERNETGVDYLLSLVQTNCNRAIEEARDSPADMRKLNQFLDRFVDEQIQRKKVKQLEASGSSIGDQQIENEQLEASSLVSSNGGQRMESKQSEASSLVYSNGSQQIESGQLEASGLEASSLVISKAESRLQRKKVKSSVELSMKGERKKQRVCSYCKETGHNRTGCPKRKNVHHKFIEVGSKHRLLSYRDSTTVQILGLLSNGHPFRGHFRLLTSGPRRINEGQGAGKLVRRRSDSGSEPGKVDVSKWKKMDSRSLGITRTMVPSPPFTVLKILRSRGFEAYLVGGCVRDLLLKRTPRDFDVITTADLHQIRKQFHNCHIVGRKFPICRVHMKGTVIEVSSFKTSAKHSEDKEKFLGSQVPRGCDESDLNLWKNCMHRDFTVNSLFLDPVIHKIYDYANGMKDLLELKLRTLVPAHLSFTEDCARILRGLRIAARLGLSFSKDTETAIHKLASSILDLSESRIMMEIDLMLSFGASESSLRLLHRFHILEFLLPFQAAYITRQTTGSGQSSMMLMKLFSHMDKFITCDRPSTCRLWIGLFAFHQALLDKPQDPFVVLTFASVLYHQEWQGGLLFARQCGQTPRSFEPELSEPCGFISDDELSMKVRQLAFQVIDSIEILEKDSLGKKMLKFPGLVFIPKKSASDAAELFYVLARDVETYNKGRSSFEMNYHLLGKGDASETRFAVGKIILDTMGCGVDQDDDDNHISYSSAERRHILPSGSRLQLNGYNPKKQQPIAKLRGNKKQISEMEKKSEDGSFLELEQQKEVVFEQHIEELCDYSCPKVEDCPTEKPQETSVSPSPTQKLVCKVETTTASEKLPSELETRNPKERLNVQVDRLITKEPSSDKRKRVRPLSSLFK